MRLLRIAGLTFALIATVAMPATAAMPAWHVCFTPGQDCTGVVVGQIDEASRTVRVQAYSFTSTPILSALKRAHDRGVDVRVIVDKSSAGKQRSGSNYTAATYLTNAEVPVWVDTKVSIAHNKVIVIDEREVITGSFNFTRAADEKNAENLLILKSPALAKRYLDNWRAHQAHSDLYSPAE